jgi:hypothetical protein
MYPASPERAGAAASASAHQGGLAAAKRRDTKLGGRNAQSDKAAAEALAFAEWMRSILAELGGALSEPGRCRSQRARDTDAGGQSVG